MRDFDEHDFVPAHWRMIDGFQKGLAGKGEYCHWAVELGGRMVFTLLLDCDIRGIEQTSN